MKLGGLEASAAVVPRCVVIPDLQFLTEPHCPADILAYIGLNIHSVKSQAYNTAARVHSAKGWLFHTGELAARLPTSWIVVL